MPIKTTRPKQTGVPGIVQDGPERFVVRVWWTDPRTGHRKKKEAVCKTLSEAVAIRENPGQEQERTTRQRFADFCMQWVSEHHHQLEPSSRIYYANNLGHAIEAFGDVFVDALRPSDFRKWISGAADEYSSATLNGWLRVVRQVLDDAVVDGLLSGNPARAAKGLKERRTKGRRGNSLSAVEFRRFTETVLNCGLSEDIARLLLTAAWTGCRKGELLALRWSDYDNGELTIEHSVWHRHEKPDKNEDPRRVAVVRPLKKVLDEQRRWLFKTQHPALQTKLMFPATPRQAKAGAKRRGVDQPSWFRGMNVLDRPLRKVVEAAGVTPITLHSLRRTFENLLRSAGVDVLVRRAMAGWRSEGAQRIYAEVDPAEREAAGHALVALVVGEDD